MNLTKLFEAQRELDDYIIENQGLRGQDLVANTFVALQVELAEFANEGRWFKHWSKNRTPKEGALEEYADSVHFFLSIGNQKGWQDALYIYEEQMNPDEFSGDLTSWYLEMMYFLNKSYFEVHQEGEEKTIKFIQAVGFKPNEYFFRTAWILFLNIGINGFGFSLDQIEQAYWEKYEINKQRQATGY